MKIFARVFLFLAFIIGNSYAQQTGISGRVTDPQGAVITSATIEVKQGGSAAFNSKPNSQGPYLFPSLSAGDYMVTIKAPGFSTVKTKVTMLVGQTPDLETMLPLASTSADVVVTSDAVAVDTTSSTVAGD